MDLVQPHAIIAQHSARNRQTRQQWQVFKSHRLQVMRILAAAASDASNRDAITSLALLGVGNGNDVDLDQLAQQFGRIGLVDLDGEALTYLSRRYPEIADRLQIYRDADVSGILDWLENREPERKNHGTPQLSTACDLDHLIQHARQPALDGDAQPWGSPYHVVVSLTLYSQLIDTAKMLLGPNHPRLLELILALRDGHCQRICQMLMPGGKGILITDFVSSTTCPTLNTIAPDEFPGFVAGLIQQRNFFTGANPFAIQQRLVEMPQWDPWVQDVEVSLPWRWDLGHKAFAVAAISMTRSSV